MTTDQVAYQTPCIHSDTSDLLRGPKARTSFMATRAALRDAYPHMAASLLERAMDQIQAICEQDGYELTDDLIQIEITAQVTKK